MLTRSSTTTDFPAPETTNSGSSIANAYTLYIQYCGIEFQQDHDEAIAQYTSDFNSPPPDDPNAPDFIAWAYTHVQLYKAGYQMCEMYESKYKDLLATFVPETLSQTSTTGAPATQTSTGHKDSGGGSSEDGGMSKTDGTSTSVPKLTVLVLSLVAAHVLIRQ